MDILESMCSLVMQGNKSKQVRFVGEYALRNLLANLDVIEEAGLPVTVKILSIIEN